MLHPDCTFFCRWSWAERYVSPHFPNGEFPLFWKDWEVQEQWWEVFETLDYIRLYGNSRLHHSRISKKLIYSNTRSQILNSIQQITTLQLHPQKSCGCYQTAGFLVFLFVFCLFVCLLWCVHTMITWLFTCALTRHITHKIKNLF